MKYLDLALEHENITLALDPDHQEAKALIKAVTAGIERFFRIWPDHKFDMEFIWDQELDEK